MSQTKRASLRQLDSVLKKVHRMYGPGAIADGVWGWSGPAGPAIVWEEGPHEWAYDFTRQLRKYDIKMPARVWCEPVTGWALHVWQEVEER